MKPLALDWTRHLQDPSKKKDFEIIVRNSRLTLTRLLEILEEKHNKALAVKPADYDSPSWGYKQADDNGYRRALREVTELLSFVKG